MRSLQSSLGFHFLFILSISNTKHSILHTILSFFFYSSKDRTEEDDDEDNREIDSHEEEDG